MLIVCETARLVPIVSRGNTAVDQRLPGVNNTRASVVLDTAHCASVTRLNHLAVICAFVFGSGIKRYLAHCASDTVSQG